jgi:DNA transformation protein and related proteins
MPASAATIAFLTDALKPLGHVTARHMFGGAGLYGDGVIFAIVADDVLYFKADASTIPAFEADSMAPFQYDKGGGVTATMSYWRVPERLLDEPDQLIEWARRALAVSQAAAARARPKTSMKTKPKARP